MTPSIPDIQKKIQETIGVSLVSPTLKKKNLISLHSSLASLTHKKILKTLNVSLAIPALSRLANLQAKPDIFGTIKY